MQHNVAVYGSLRKGLGNHRLLEHVQDHEKGVTCTPYDMYSLGGFPAIVHGGIKGVVVEVYRVDQHTMDRLDGLEGYPSFYDREEVEVVLESGEEVTAWIYYMHTAPNDHIVTGNDWKVHVDNRYI